MSSLKRNKMFVIAYVYNKIEFIILTIGENKNESQGYENYTIFNCRKID